MRLEGVDHRHRGLDGEADPVAHVETGVAARLLDGADQVAGEALDLELGGDRGVEHDDPSLPGSVAAAPSDADTSRNVYSSGCSSTPPTTTRSPSMVQSPALWALMTCCVWPPSRGPSARRVEDQLRPADRLHVVGQLDLLDVELVAQDVEVRAA